MTPSIWRRCPGPPDSAIEPFEFHGCDCGVASFKGQPPWELHTAGDELIHVLAGGTRLTVRGVGGEVVRQLRPGDLAVVPSGCWHRNDAPGGVTLLFMTPREGNRHTGTIREWRGEEGDAGNPWGRRSVKALRGRPRRGARSGPEAVQARRPRRVGWWEARMTRAVFAACARRRRCSAR